MGGAAGDADVQYVELRMAAGGQPLVSGNHLCFYDGTGSPYARFLFTADVTSAALGDSILIGTSEFDAVWTAGSADFVFSGSNTVAIASGADVDHPLRSPGGKVSFGTDGATTPAQMCQGQFANIDSVAYGTGYSGVVDFGTKLNADLPTAGTDAVRLQGPVCFPPGCTRDNSTDYAITDVNVTGDHPRNNAGAAGTVGPLDSDGDGFPDSSDNCPLQPNPLQISPPWTVPIGDLDCDGTLAGDASSGEVFIGTDPNDACADTAMLLDERGPAFGEQLSPWPYDVNDDGGATLSDVLAVSPSFNKIKPEPDYDPRCDWNTDARVTLSDVLSISPFFNKFCYDFFDRLP